MRRILLVPLFISVVGCSATQSLEPAPHSNPKLESLVATGALVLDVRSPEEFASGHVVEALNVPFTDIKRAETEFVSKKTKPVVVYCKTGRRAEIARQALLRLGFTQVVNAGGLNDIQRDLKRSSAHQLKDPQPSTY